jgi:hypothetical protein
MKSVVVVVVVIVADVFDDVFVLECPCRDLEKKRREKGGFIQLWLVG